MISRSKYLFSSIALAFLFFVFPISESNRTYSIESLVLLLVASIVTAVLLHIAPVGATLEPIGSSHCILTSPEGLSTCRQWSTGAT